MKRLLDRLIFQLAQHVEATPQQGNAGSALGMRSIRQTLLQHCDDAVEIA